MTGNSESDVAKCNYVASIGWSTSCPLNTPMIFAARNGHLEIMKYLVSLGAIIRNLGDVAIKEAAQGGHLALVQYLVSLEADIRAENDYAVKSAAENGHRGMVYYLTSLGAPMPKMEPF